MRSAPASHTRNLRSGLLLRVALMISLVATLLVPALPASAADTITLLDDDVSQSNAFAEGRAGNNAMVLDAAANPVILYANGSFSDDEGLYLVHCDDPTCSGGGDTLVRLSTINGPSINDLVLDGAGNPVVVFTGVSDGGSVRLVHCDDPNCAGTEVVRDLPLADNQDFKSVAVAVDAGGNPVVAYAQDPRSSSNPDEGIRLLHCDDPDCDPVVGTSSDTIVPLYDGSATFNVAVDDVRLDGAGNPVVLTHRSRDSYLTHCDDPACDDGLAESENLVADNVTDAAALRLDGLGRPVIATVNDDGVHVVRCGDPDCATAVTPVLVDDDPVRFGAAIGLQLDGDVPVLSYHDDTNTYLRVARCGDPTCTTATVTVPALGGSRDSFPALQLTGDGNPLVVFQTDKDLVLLACDSLTCTNVRPGSQSPDTPQVVQGGGTGPSGDPTPVRESAVAVDANGNPIIATFDRVEGDGGDVADSTELRITHCNDPDCVGGDESVTAPATLDGSDLQGGRGAGGLQMTLDDDGHPVVAFLGDGKLNVVHCDDVDCDAASVEQPVDVENFSSPRVDLDLDASGFPVVAYETESMNFAGGFVQPLQILRCNDPDCAGGDDATFPAPTETPDGQIFVDDSDALVVVTSAAGASFDGTAGPEPEPFIEVIRCGNDDCSADNDVSVIPDTAGLASPADVELDTDGFPTTLTTDFVDGTRLLHVIRCDDTYCGEGGESVRFLPGIDAGSASASLAVADNLPVIAFEEDDFSDLTVLRCDDERCDGGGETLTTVDVENRTGLRSDIVTDGDGNPLISFHAFDRESATIEVVHCSTPTCGDGTPVTLSGPGSFDPDPDPDPGPDAEEEDLPEFRRANLDIAITVGAADPAAPNSRTVTVELTNSGDASSDPFDLALGITGPADLTLPEECTDDGDEITCAIERIRPDSTATLVITLTATGVSPVAVGVQDELITIEPVNADGPVEAAVQVSNERFDPDTGTAFAQLGARASHVVLSRVDVFADSLTGSVLTTAAPLLFTETGSLPAATAAEIDRVLTGSGTVYLLGGAAAIGPEVEQTLTDRGYTPVRLAGDTRIETAVAVADQAVELNGEPAIVAIARAEAPVDNPTAAWADAVTAGGWAADTGHPILLTPTDSAHPATLEWLSARTPAVTILGGTAAISQATAEGLGATGRVDGPNRYATAVAVASTLWTDPADGRLIGPGGSVDGWTYILTAAGLSADLDQPILLTELDRLPEETDDALCGTATRSAYLLLTPTDRTSPVVTAALEADCTS